jgi:hypothetical protein
MRIKDIFRLFIIISSIILFFHILITSSLDDKYAWFHIFVNLGIIILNLIGEIIIISIEKRINFP